MPVPNTQRIHQIGQNLHINKLHRNADNGIYNCHIENGDGEINHQISTAIKLETICKYLFGIECNIKFIML